MVTQLSLPCADVVDVGWTRYPDSFWFPPGVADGDFRRLDELIADDDLTYLFSRPDPQGDTFEVKLAPVAAPQRCRDGLLTVRLRSTDNSGTIPVSVLLLQGGEVLIFDTVRPGSSYSNVFLHLPAWFLDQVANFTDLRVRVIAGLPRVGCCANPLPVVLYGTISSQDCSCMVGTYPLAYTPTMPGTSLAGWYYSGTGCRGKTIVIRVWCNQGVAFYCYVSCGSNNWGQTGAGWTCDPFSTSFNMMITSSGSSDCCTGTNAQIDLKVTQ